MVAPLPPPSRRDLILGTLVCAVILYVLGMAAWLGWQSAAHLRWVP